MDHFLREIHVEVFKQWILKQSDDVLKFSINKDDPDRIDVITSQARGYITFNPSSILEFGIVGDTKNREFYLHFQMKYLHHAVRLFYEFVNTMRKLDSNKKVRIMLSCSGGLTTGYFASKLKEAAKMLELDYEFEAISYTKLYTEAERADVILLAPQIAYKKAETESIFQRKVVEVIPPRVFASYDVAACLLLIQSAIKKKKSEIRIRENLMICHELEVPTKLLVISLMRHVDLIRIAARVYDHNGEVDDLEINKRDFHFNDLKDVIDIALAEYPDISAVGISTPARMNDDLVMMPLEDANNKEFLQYLSHKYKQKFYWFNDSDSLALGYYMTQTEYESLCFFYHPMGMPGAGLGSVYKGQLIQSKNGMAGEIIWMMDKEESKELIKTPEGTVEMVAKALIPIISILSPEAICIHCTLIADLELVRKRLAETIPEKYLPKLIKLYGMKEYSLVGCLKQTVDAFK